MSDFDFGMIDIDAPIEAPVAAPVVISMNEQSNVDSDNQSFEQSAYQNDTESQNHLTLNDRQNSLSIGDADQTVSTIGQSTMPKSQPVKLTHRNIFNLSDSAVSTHTIEADPSLRRSTRSNSQTNNQPTEQPITQSINQSNNQSGSQLAEQSNNQSNNQSSNQSDKHSENESKLSTESDSHVTDESKDQSVAQSTNQAIEPSNDQTITEPKVYTSINPSNNQIITFKEVASIERIIDVSDGPRFLDSFTKLKPAINQSTTQSSEQSNNPIINEATNQSIETEFRSLAANNELRDKLSQYKKRRSNNMAPIQPIDSPIIQPIIQPIVPDIPKSTKPSNFQSKQAEIGDDFISLGANQANNQRKKFEVPKSHHFDPSSPWVTRNYSLSNNQSTKQSNNDNFSFRLHEELLDFASFFSPKKFEEQIRANLVKKIEFLVSQILPKSELFIFGSNATKLYLPMSDVDIVIFNESTNSNQTDVSMLQLIAKAVEEAGWASYIEVIAHARIPIIKLIDKESNLKIDLSINQLSGLEAAKFIQSILIKQPAFRPLILFLKYFLACRNLNDTFSGGVGSFLLQLMLIHHLNFHPSQTLDANLGLLLISFFDCFGNQLHYGNVGLTIEPPGFYSKHSNNRFNSNRPYLLSVSNPLDDTHDVASNSFAILKIRKCFQYAHSQLTRRDVIEGRYRGSLLALIVSTDDELVSERVKMNQSNAQANNQSTNQSGYQSYYPASTSQAKPQPVAANPVIHLSLKQSSKSPEVDHSIGQPPARPVKTITLKRRHAEVEDPANNQTSPSDEQPKKLVVKRPVVLDRSRVIRISPPGFQSNGQPVATSLTNQSITQPTSQSNNQTNDDELRVDSDGAIMIDLDDDLPITNSSSQSSNLNTSSISQSNSKSNNQSNNQAINQTNSQSNDQSKVQAEQTSNLDVSMDGTQSNMSNDHDDDELPPLEQVDDHVNQAVNQSPLYTNSHLINQSNNQSLTQSVNQSMEQSNNQSSDQSSSQQVGTHELELTKRQLKRKRKQQREADEAEQAKKAKKFERRERKKAEKLEMQQVNDAMSESLNESNNQSNNQSKQSSTQSNSQSTIQPRFVRADDGTMLIDLADSEDDVDYETYSHSYIQSVNPSNYHSNNQSNNQSNNEESDTSTLASTKRIKKKEKKEKKGKKLAQAIQEVEELSSASTDKKGHNRRSNNQSNNQSNNHSIPQSGSKKHKKKQQQQVQQQLHTPNRRNSRSNNQSNNQSNSQSNSQSSNQSNNEPSTPRTKQSGKPKHRTRSQNRGKKSD